MPNTFFGLGRPLFIASLVIAAVFIACLLVFFIAGVILRQNVRKYFLCRILANLTGNFIAIPVWVGVFLNSEMPYRFEVGMAAAALAGFGLVHFVVIMIRIIRDMKIEFHAARRPRKIEKPVEKPVEQVVEKPVEQVVEK